MIRALRIHRTENGAVPRLERLDEADLPAGTVTVDVSYSSLNYKDGLALTGRGKIIRGDLPFVPGIDLAGTVVESTDARFSAGDRVVGNGGGLGELIWGGYATRARPNPEYLAKLPDALSFEEAMAIGTAGFTAMLAVMTLEREQVDRNGTVLVSGASGGVGSLAVALLAANGFRVAASTGSRDAHDYLRMLGAVEIIDRSELSEGARRPLDSTTWSGAVDSVGGATLASILSRLGWHGTVAVCGNAGGAKVDTTVFPFILRGVKMMGIDSNTSPRAERQVAWQRLASELPRDALHAAYHVVSLAEVPDEAERIVRGQIRGRTVVRVAD